MKEKNNILLVVIVCIVAIFALILLIINQRINTQINTQGDTVGKVGTQIPGMMSGPSAIWSPPPCGETTSGSCFGACPTGQVCSWVDTGEGQGRCECR